MKKKFTVHIMKKTEKVSIKPLYTITDTFLDPIVYPAHFCTDKTGRVALTVDLVFDIIDKVESASRKDFKLKQRFYSEWSTYITFQDNVVVTKDDEFDKDELKQNKVDQKPHTPILNERSIKVLDLASFIYSHYNNYGQNIDYEFEDDVDTNVDANVDDRSSKYFSIGRNAFIKQNPKLIGTVKRLLSANFDTAADPIFECGEKDDFAIFTRAFALFSMSAKSHERISISIIQNQMSPPTSKRKYRIYSHYPDYITDGTLAGTTRAIKKIKKVVDAGVNVHVVTAHETLDVSIYKNENLLVDGIDRSRNPSLNTEITTSDLWNYISDYLYPEQERPDVVPIILTEYGDSSDSETPTSHAMLSLSGSHGMDDDEIIERTEMKLQQLAELWDKITLCVNNQSDFEERIWMPAVQNNESMAMHLKSGNCTFGNLLKNDDSSLVWNEEGISYLADFFRHFLIFLGEKKLEESLIGGIFKHLKMFNEIKNAESKQQPLYKINNKRTKQPETDEELKKQADSFGDKKSLYRKIISALFTQLCTLA
jgi:hypothetical protein